MSSTLRRIGGEIIVKKLSYNILDGIRREQILPKCFSKAVYVQVKASPSIINFTRLVYQSAY